MLKLIIIVYMLLFQITPLLHAQEDRNSLSIPDFTRMIPVGDRILSISTEKKIYSYDPYLSNPIWTAITSDNPLFANYKLETIFCSLDGNGDCAAAMVRDKHIQLATIGANTNRLLYHNVVLNQLITVLDGNNIIYMALNDSKQKLVYSYNPHSLESRLLGNLKSDENPEVIWVDGEPRLYASNEQNQLSPLNSDNIIGRLPLTAADSNRSLTKFGVIFNEDWFTGNKEGIDLKFLLSNFKQKSDGTLQPNISTIKFPYNQEIHPFGSTIVGTSSGDIIMVEASKKGKDLSFICMDKLTQKASSTRFQSKSSFLNVTTVGSPAGRGFLVKSQSPMMGETLDYIAFTDEGLSDLGSVDCGKRSFHAKVITYNSYQAPDNWRSQNLNITSKKGHRLAALIMQPKDTIIKRIIFDVYGAYGSQRYYDPLPQKFYDELRATGTAIVYPIIRGDGDFGRDYANKSHNPDRQNAIDDLSEVIDILTDKHLPNDAKIILRGTSAGGWLAVQTALQNPDLVDQVISASGAYFIEDLPLSKLGKFFSKTDSVDTSSKPKCQSTFFTLMGYASDSTTPFDQLERLGKFLSANECRGKIIGLAGNQHVFTSFRNSSNDETYMNL